MPKINFSYYTCFITNIVYFRIECVFLVYPKYKLLNSGYLFRLRCNFKKYWTYTKFTEGCFAL